MNVLITGIHGFIGSNLVVFLEKYYTLYGLDVISSDKKGVLQIFSWKDIEPTSFPFQTLPQFDAIIHLAGKAHDTKNQSAAQSYFDINTGLTQKIFDFFLESSAKKFIFFSSVKAAADSVVGNVLTEDVIPTPVGPYGESKIKAEEYIKNHFMFPTSSISEDRSLRLEKEKGRIPKNKQVYILRPCMIHGPGNKGNLNLLYNVVKKGPYGRCVFHCDNTVVDHQSVDIKFENQVTASFLMTAFTDQCARRIRLMGTKGEIKGDMDAGTIEIRDFVSGNLETIELHTPANGHNGSDMSMMHDFVRMVGEGRKGKTDAAVSVESHLMALAAEEARITGQVVNLRGFANENK